MNQSANKFKQLNAFAMQYGIALGAWGILSLVTTGVSLKITSLSLLSSIVTLASPVIAALLTSRFRKSTTTPEEGFTFGRAFLFVFTTGFYASICIAAFVFLYLAYWDNGYIFNAYESLLSSPEYAGSMQQSGLMNSLNANSVSDMIDAMRSISPAGYASSVIYMSFMTVFNASADIKEPFPGTLTRIPLLSSSMYAFWIVFGLVDSSIDNDRTDGILSPSFIIPLSTWSSTCLMSCS